MKPAIHVPPTVEELKERFSYDPETGVVIYKVDVAYNVVKGRVAGSVSKGGYLSVRINGRGYPLHRVIWALHHGEWPPHFIDHRNGVRFDNRIDNLRSATGTQNGHNSAKRSDNTSGHKGVTWNKICRKWRARINHAHLGQFDSKDDAITARNSAARELHGEFYNPGATTSGPASLT